MVSEVLEKLKKIGTKEPISKEDANILALTGRVCTLEDRVSEFLKSVNEVIVAKARDQQFMHLIIVPKDILVKSKEIQEILF